MPNGVAIRLSYRRGNLSLYLMLIPFFFPKGFGEYLPVYKMVSTALLAMASAFILANFIYNVSRKKTVVHIALLSIILYHVTLLIITLIIQQGINEGIQKIFLAPALCILCVNQVKKNSYVFLNVLSNILIVNILLNVTIFNQWMFPDYFLVDKHIVFIGHVQVASQIGIIALFVGNALALKYNEKKGKFLCILALVNMIYSDTVVSYLCVAIYLIGKLVVSKRKKARLVEHVTPIFLAYLFFSILMLIITFKLKGFYIWKGIDISMNGRMFIWQDAFEKMKDHWIFGYGAYGVRLKVFWNAWSGNANGFNYAHNEILQLLLDGGIILALQYVIMIILALKNVGKVQTNLLKRVICLLFGIFMTVALVESITEYYYYFAFLSIMACLPYINMDERMSYGERIKQQLGIKNEIIQ